ncbi:MAG: hypothetical protein KKF50_03745 [Nanoarchaeota archaeon]|nr:hypothetical protein [Nanoarchaeota archaeon]
MALEDIEYPYELFGKNPLPKEFYETYLATPSIGDNRIIAFDKDPVVAKEKAIEAGFPNPKITYYPDPAVSDRHSTF